MRILILTTHFSPNVGGVETHLDDLVKALVKRKKNTRVLAYNPLVTKVEASFFESKFNGYLKIMRIPWFRGHFYKLVSKPFLEFLYLVPGLFLVTPFVILASKINVIHAHGLIAGFTGIFWAKILGKRVVVSFHSVYSFPKKGLYIAFVRFFLKRADVVLCLSDQSVAEFIQLGLEKKKVRRFTYWVDSDLFNKDIVGIDAKNKKSFNLLFVGRLIREKGVEVLLNASKNFDEKVVLLIAGTGPMENMIKERSKKQKNIVFLGRKSQSDLPLLYSSTDLFIIPSIHEEGFGRVILEALWCGVPVLGSNRGAIPEAIDESVGKLIDISEENIIKWVNYFVNNRSILSGLESQTRKFAEERYSEKNVEEIIKAYNT